MRSFCFKLLGPLTVEADGETIPLGGPRQRTVLATLLLSAGTFVSVDVLIETVWGGTPPATARNQIAVCINSLRRLFRDAAGDERLIVTGHRSYAFVPGGHTIDVQVLDLLVARARELAGADEHAGAAECFRQALALWNGTALEGLAGDVDDARSRITELWLDANEEHADLLLRLGQHRAVVPQMATVVEEWPLREQARLHLMVALSRSGRRAHALEVYRAGRRIFIDEIGVEPGPALQELHQSILRELAAAERPKRAVPAASRPMAARPAQLPAPAAAFTGRAAELADLDRLLDAAKGDVPLAIAAISGTSGVGKSALAVYWSNRAAKNFPDGQLFVDMRGHDCQEAPVTPARALGRFLQDFGVPLQDIPDDLDGRSALYRSVLDGKRMLVVLDNVRSVSQILPLIPGEGPSCVVITGRDSFDRLAGDYATLKLGLQPLDFEESGRMLASVAKGAYTAAHPDHASRLVELCGGLPLALRIVGASLITKPAGSSVELVVRRLEDRSRRLDALSPHEGGVRGGIWTSYRGLPTEAARLLRLLGLLPVQDFAAWVGAALLDVSSARAEDLLDRLVEAQLLDVRPGACGMPTRFGLHSLLRVFAWERGMAEEHPEERQAALGRAFRAWLTLADRAHRQLRGSGHVAALREWSGRGQHHWFPDEEPWSGPMEWFESEQQAAMDLIDDWGDAEHQGRPWELVVRMVPLFETYSDLKAWRAAADTALQVARATGDTEGVAVMLSSLGTLEIYRRNYAQARALLLDAKSMLEPGGNDRTWATVLRNLALCARFSGELDEATLLCEQAVDHFHRANDHAGRSHAIGLHAQIELERGENTLGIALLRDAIAAGQDSRSLRVEAQNLYRLAEALLREGEAHEAEQTGHEVVVLSRTVADRLGEAHGLRVRGEAQWRQQQTEKSLASLSQALQAAAEVEDTFLQARVHLDLACASALRQDPVGARVYAESALSWLRGLASPHWEQRAERLRRFLIWTKPATVVSPAELVRLLESSASAAC